MCVHYLSNAARFGLCLQTKGDINLIACWNHVWLANLHVDNVSCYPIFVGSHTCTIKSCFNWLKCNALLAHSHALMFSVRRQWSHQTDTSFLQFVIFGLASRPNWHRGKMFCDCSPAMASWRNMSICVQRWVVILKAPNLSIKIAQATQPMQALIYSE